MPANDPMAHHEPLRRCFALARKAAERGDEPFAALLWLRGKAVLTATNRVMLDGDRTKHAELLLVSEAGRLLCREDLVAATLYASTEPCAMCAGAIYWTGISRVVFGCSQEAFARVAGKSLNLPCRAIFGAGRRPTEVTGPLFEDEALAVHERYWPTA